MKRYPRSCTIALLYDMLVEIPPLGLSKERPLMNVLFSSMEYDFHSLVKVAEIAGLAGVVTFHQAGDDYLVTFPDGEKTEAIVRDYRARLRDLEHNIWSH